MTGCEWHSMYILRKAVSSHLFLWLTVCEWHYPFCESSLITSCPMANRMWVILHIIFCEGSLITSFPITNSQWVILHTPWKAFSSHIFLWPTASEWHCTFCVTSFPMTNRMWVTKLCERQSHGVSLIFLMENRQWVKLQMTVSWHFINFSDGKQAVSEVANCVKGSLMTSVPMTNSLWVTLSIYERKSHHMCSYDKQGVSAIAHFVKGHPFLWPIACELHCPFC